MADPPHSRPVLGGVIRPDHITRSMLRDHPTWLFLFGDNMARVGFGGQAKEMRGEPNARGVPTKWAPAMTPSAFITDQQWRDHAGLQAAVNEAFDEAEAHLLRGNSVVVPSAGLGTGLANLGASAPGMLAHIEGRIAALTSAATKDPRHDP